MILLNVEVFNTGFSFLFHKSIKPDVTELRHFVTFSALIMHVHGKSERAMRRFTG